MTTYLGKKCINHPFYANMKTILIIILLSSSIAVYGQTFDFQKKILFFENQTCKPFKVKNDNFTFSIININTFKYDVFIDNKLVNYNLEKPDYFKLLSDTAKNKIIADNFVSPTLDIVKISIPEISDLKSLIELYLKYIQVEAFYKSLLDLARSDISTQQLIFLKKGLFYQFVDKQYTSILQSEIDLNIIPCIGKYYASLSTVILNSEPKILKIDPSHKLDIERIITHTKEINNKGILSNLIKLYAEINDETFTVSSFIKRPDSDEVIINLSAKPNSIYNKNGKEINIEIPILVEGDFKIDYSTGLFVSNLVDKSFVNQPIYNLDSVVGYKLVKEFEKNFSYGIASYMHCYYRFNTVFNVGLSLGIGIDQNTQTKILPGFSIFLGRKNRFILNSGFSIGKAKGISKILYTDHIYTNKIDIGYSEPYDIGWHVGLSYNISK